MPMLRPCKAALRGPLKAHDTRRARVQRASSHTLALALSLLTACGGADEEEPVTASTHGDPEAKVEELIRLLTPLDPTLTSDHHDEHLHARRALQEELEESSEEFGRAALAAFHQHRDDIVDVRRGLLQVAARSAPVDTAPLLEKLVVEYGHPLEERAEATLLIGEAAPERALAILEPMCRRTKRNETLPHDEFLIRGWVRACEELDISPVPVLVDNATNITKDETSRHYSVKQLGDHVDPLGRQALEIILIESTGNGYIRRMAAQSLRKTLPAEDACALFKEVADREAESNFLIFLLDVIAETCP
ncbi:MAG: hypothetical protein MK291_02250 [Planctomycetes bacterium]|nr:hypothetical protein [Planctomycetota bacterium]